MRRRGQIHRFESKNWQDNVFLNISLTELELCEHDRTDVVGLGASEEMKYTQLPFILRMEGGRH